MGSVSQQTLFQDAIAISQPPNAKTANQATTNPMPFLVLHSLQHSEKSATFHGQVLTFAMFAKTENIGTPPPNNATPQPLAPMQTVRTVQKIVVEDIAIVVLKDTHFGQQEMLEPPPHAWPTASQDVL